ncbi:hypothetical protein HSBAA_47130 [Vreelandella sulfidaeris]|uniref:Uncharacterized protein n=1 Tax=Vreelandella sulfidaeris TaxID=115553 RepID=A0A455UCR6_9GAMM|nr:hypothetical protein HSBAA_47130 [Halomonas sulfidaeris]
MRTKSYVTQAKIRKLKFYYTGKACKYGHRAQRYTVDKHCVVCKKIKIESI